MHFLLGNMHRLMCNRHFSLLQRSYLLGKVHLHGSTRIRIATKWYWHLLLGCVALVKVLLRLTPLENLLIRVGLNLALILECGGIINLVYSWGAHLHLHLGLKALETLVVLWLLVLANCIEGRTHLLPLVYHLSVISCLVCPMDKILKAFPTF